MFKPSGKVGPLDITVKIIGYKKSALKVLGLATQPSFDRTSTIVGEEEDIGDKLSSTIDLIFVDDVKIPSDRGSLFNHPKNNVSLHLKNVFSILHVLSYLTLIIKISFTSVRIFL